MILVVAALTISGVLIGWLGWSSLHVFELVAILWLWCDRVRTHEMLADVHAVFEKRCREINDWARRVGLDEKERVIYTEGSTRPR